MDVLRGFIGSKNDETIANPGVWEWIEAIPSNYFIFLCFGCIFVFIVIIMGIVHLIYVLGYISNEQIQKDMYWIVFMCPIVSLCGLIGMFLPRSALFLYAIALLYFMLCIFIMVTLMTTLHGSRSAMCEKLQARGIRISVRARFAAWMLSILFSKIRPHRVGFFIEYNFRRIEFLVFQSPLVRIFLEILNIVIFFELNSRNNLYFQLSNLIGIISLFIGSYGSYMIIPPGSELLAEYRFSVMFKIVDFSQLAYSVQKFLFDFLAVIGVFTNGPVLPDTAKAQFFTSFLLTLEMFIVSILATIIFRPSQTVFFDKHIDSQLIDDDTIKTKSNQLESYCSNTLRNSSLNNSAPYSLNSYKGKYSTPDIDN